MASHRSFLLLLLVLAVALSLAVSTPASRAAPKLRSPSVFRADNETDDDHDHDDHDHDDHDDDHDLKSMEPEFSEEPSEVCVDVHHLSSVAQHDLVHSRHIRANVLCPKHASLPCATADHMLRVNGRSMSYREYCLTVTCRRDRMPVNSVLSHIWKEESHGGGVVLTMLDARHPETAQNVLHRLTALRRRVSRALM